jgi:hypothetical protein
MAQRKKARKVSPLLGDERTARKHIAEDSTLDHALEHLNKADPHLAAIIADLAAEFRIDGPRMSEHSYYYGGEPRMLSVIEQVSRRMYTDVRDQNQFAVVVQSLVRRGLYAGTADILLDALCVRCNAGYLGGLQPQKILALSDAELFGPCGGPQKGLYVRSAAEAFGNDPQYKLESLDALGDSGAQAVLQKIKGVGDTLSSNYLINGLSRVDVLPFGDHLLDTFLKKFYFESGRNWVKQKLSQSEALGATEPWRPYRSVAAMLIWRSVVGRPENPECGGEEGECSSG